MKASIVFALVGAASLAAGAALFVATRPPAQVAAPEIGPSAIYAASFADSRGQAAALGRFEGRPLVLNFWATWCAPCREEMPAFSRVSTRYGPRVQFVGLAQDDPAKVRAYAQQLGIAYPLWTGGDEVMELSRRLGNRMKVLPFTVILDPQGRVVEQKVGAYTEAQLQQRLAAISGN
jgi:thiol-disulfide isomerase/thioredoxin